MNKKLNQLIIVFFTFLLAIFLLNSLIKGIKINKSDITNMNILNYIPRDYELTILTNSTDDNIKRFIKENISAEKRDELNIIKDSIISYLGFNLTEKIENIYDNEFALTFFRNELNKIDILLIFKLKENKDINNIINIEELNKSDKIIELKRPGKLNYISHIFQTKDNYIIASSNKKLIDSALQSDNTIENFSRNLIPDDVNLKEIKLLSISKYINSEDNSNKIPPQVNKLVSIINFEDNKIKLRSFSPNINKINPKVFNNRIDDVKDIIFTNKYSQYKQNINFLYNDINQKDFIEEISQGVNDNLLFITNNNNWVLCFENKLSNNSSTHQFNFLKKFKKEDIYIKDVNYSIYTNDRLKIKDNNIIYEKENPIFSFKNEFYTYISNNFDALLTITEKTDISDQYFNYNNDIKPYKYILNDIFFIKSINNKQLSKYYKSLRNLQYLVYTELFTLKDININISNIIPERCEKIYLESNLEIL